MLAQVLDYALENTPDDGSNRSRYIRAALFNALYEAMTEETQAMYRMGIE